MCIRDSFGGEIASDVWSYPDAVNTVEESIIILPKKGLKFQVPRMKMCIRDRNNIDMICNDMI